MLSTEHIDFCTNVKEMSLGLNGNQQIFITCTKTHPKAILTSSAIYNYSIVIDILKRIYGHNYEKKEENSSERYKDCDEIFLHFAIL